MHVATMTGTGTGVEVQPREGENMDQPGSPCERWRGKKNIYAYYNSKYYVFCSYNVTY